MIAVAAKLEIMKLFELYRSGYSYKHWLTRDRKMAASG